MRLTPRRITVGLVSMTVVAAMTGVSTWAMADDGAGAAAVSAAPVSLVVGYKNDADPASAVRTMSAMGARTTGSATAKQALDALHATTVQVAAGNSASLMASLKADPNVAYVEVDHQVKATELTPDDPFYTAGSQPEMSQVDVPAAWSTTTGSSAVTIAVVDTGVTAVGDLTGAVLPGYNFISNNTSTDDDFAYTDTTTGQTFHGHGTAVTSLIAARGNNAAGMAGVCWSCQILPVKVLDGDGSGTDSTVAKGIIWAVQHGARIINMSLGGAESSSVLADAVTYANLNSVLVVAAAGNDGSTARSYPAALPDVVAVGATACPDWESVPTCTTSPDTQADFTNYNSGTDKWVDVAAPGVDGVMDSTGAYNTGWPGTSFSTPIVSGIAGLIKADHPGYTGWSLMNAIQQGAKKHNVGTWVTYGEVDAAQSLTIGTDTTAPTSTGLSPAQNAKVRGTVKVTPVKIADNLSGIRLVNLYVDGVFKGTSHVSPYSVAWNSAGRNGSVKLQLRIYDKAGNNTFLNRTIIADNTAPTVKITKAPANKSKIKGTVKISYTGSDKYGIKNFQLLINGKVVQTHTSPGVFAFVATKYPKNITVQIRAYDVAGNSRLTTKYSYHR